MKDKEKLRLKLNRFYVYAYLNSDGSPYYIGKGCGKRSSTPHLADAPVPKKASQILSLAERLDEETAHFLEARLIAQYGRKAAGTGSLLNVRPGRPAAPIVRFAATSKLKAGIAHNGSDPEVIPVILGYCRISTDGDDQDNAYQAQADRLTAAGCDRVIAERESGRKADREGLAEVMALVTSGNVKELVFTRVDRLGRDAAQTDTLLALCDLQQVKVRALDGGIIETASPQGFLLARVMTTMAEVESRMLSQRLRRNFDVYRSQGRHLRRRIPFGYDKGDGTKLVPHSVNFYHALRVLKELREQGSFTRVANSLPEWCPWTPAATSLQAWFVNPVIRGHIGHHLDPKSGKGWRQQWGEIHYDQHPALIADADWRELAALLQRPTNRFKNTNTTEVQHGMTGLLRCASCGHLLRRNTSNGVAWWRCRHRLCNARGGAREDRVLPVVIDACVAEAHRLAALLAQPASEDPMLIVMRDELDLMERLAARNPDNRAMAAAVKEQQHRIEAVQRQEAPAVDETTARALKDPYFFSGMTPQEQRPVFAMVLRSVVVGERGEPIQPQPRMS
jgi:DNA invertase Pin-like site-specific DNA recombinase